MRAVFMRAVCMRAVFMRAVCERAVFMWAGGAGGAGGAGAVVWGYTKLASLPMLNRVSSQQHYQEFDPRSMIHIQALKHTQALQHSEAHKHLGAHRGTQHRATCIISPILSCCGCSKTAVRLDGPSRRRDA